jgi:riboflavin kinase
MADSVRLEISGVVASGLGKGAHFIALDWVKARLIELMGAAPYPGTLNVRVAGELRDRLFAGHHRFAPILPPGEGNCPGYLAAVRLRGAGQEELGAWAVLPDATVHGDIIEIVSPHFLRQRLQVADGDRIEIFVEIS